MDRYAEVRANREKRVRVVICLPRSELESVDKWGFCRHAQPEHGAAQPAPPRAQDSHRDRRGHPRRRGTKSEESSLACPVRFRLAPIARAKCEPRRSRRIAMSRASRPPAGRAETATRDPRVLSGSFRLKGKLRARWVCPALYSEGGGGLWLGQAHSNRSTLSAP